MSMPVSGHVLLIIMAGRIATIFSDVFGKNARPTPQLQTLYMIATLPE